MYLGLPDLLQMKKDDVGDIYDCGRKKSDD
jgi:hypothetical protein